MMIMRNLKTLPASSNYGGETRTERFGNLGCEYAQHLGYLESSDWNAAMNRFFP